MAIIPQKSITTDPDQKECSKLWCQGSFALLRCFHLIFFRSEISNNLVNSLAGYWALQSCNIMQYVQYYVIWGKCADRMPPISEYKMPSLTDVVISGWPPGEVRYRAPYSANTVLIQQWSIECVSVLCVWKRSCRRSESNEWDRWQEGQSSVWYVAVNKIVKQKNWKQKERKIWKEKNTMHDKIWSDQYSVKTYERFDLSRVLLPEAGSESRKKSTVKVFSIWIIF